MSDTASLRTIGGFIAVLGIVALLMGLAMPATSTHTSQTCVDDPTSYDQSCVTGTVSTPNPLRGPTIGAGVLALLGGIGIYLLGGHETTDPADPVRTEEGETGGFAEKLQEHRDTSQSATDPAQDTVDASPGRTESEWQSEHVGTRHPLRSRVPDILGYPVAGITGAVTCGFAVAILAAIAGGGPAWFFVGALLGAIWGGLAWYDLDAEQFGGLAVAFSYLVVAVGGVFVADGVIAVLGLSDSSLAGQTVFLLGLVAILVGWKYTRGRYARESSSH